MLLLTTNRLACVFVQPVHVCSSLWKDCSETFAQGEWQDFCVVRVKKKWFFSGFKTITLKGPFKTASDDNFFYFSEKTSLDISCESSFHLKILLGTLRVKMLNKSATTEDIPFFFFQSKLDLAFHVNHLPYFLWKRKIKMSSAAVVIIENDLKFCTAATDKMACVYSVNPHQTAPVAVWSGSTLFAIPLCFF